MKHTYPFFDTPAWLKTVLLTVSKKRYQIMTVAVCLVFAGLLMMESSMVYADPTSTPLVISTSQYQNLIPSPTPLPTSNATALPFFPNDTPRKFAYTLINGYRYFNIHNVIDWVEWFVFGGFILHQLFNLIRRMKRPE